MQSKFTRVGLPKIKVAFLLFTILVALIMGMKGVFSLHVLMTQSGLTPVTVVKFIFDTGADLKIINGRTNVVLLGIAGGVHDGADLTDTILVLSFAPTSRTLSMVSLPRDVWSDTLKDKINSAYHYGEEKQKGGGLILAKAIISDMVGLPIEYGLVLDFSRFQDIINLVGGVKVHVPIAFTDSEFPIPGKENDICGGDEKFACRYEQLHFDAGIQTMDGDRALKYVRSRHADGDEGTDFARSKRQQDVLVALKSRITVKEVLLNPQKMIQIYRAFDTATDTNMNLGELLTVGKIFVNVPQKNIARISIEDQLYSPPESWYENRYVLIPKESFESVHEYINKSLK